MTRMRDIQEYSLGHPVFTDNRYPVLTAPWNKVIKSPENFTFRGLYISHETCDLNIQYVKLLQDGSIIVDGEFLKTYCELKESPMSCDLQKVYFVYLKSFDEEIEGEYFLGTATSIPIVDHKLAREAKTHSERFKQSKDLFKTHSERVKQSEDSYNDEMLYEFTVCNKVN